MEKPLTKNIRADGSMPDLQAYEQGGGYQGLRSALKLEPKDVQDLVKRSGLRGRGGAGFPTGLKWSFMPLGENARRPRFLIVNADEMEPGAFKDRLLLEGDPHQLIEGALVGAYALQADVVYIFLRHEYRLAAARIELALAQARQAQYIGQGVLGSDFSVEVRLHTSAGRYMCGEETGLLNSLEGKRATPRSKPPHPQTVGLFGLPTIVNNVETICCLGHIAAHGPKWFNSLSLTAEGGTKLYGVSGRVVRPGLWELPMGTSLREIIYEHAGGMREGCTLRGLLPGGASTDFLTPEHLDVAMDFESVVKAGSRLGTGTVVVLDNRTCPVGMVLNLIRFFARESCGWCTPCREGLPWAQRMLEAIENGRGTSNDMQRLRDLTEAMGLGRTFCSLAPGAMEPLKSALKLFGQDFEEHITRGLCPWR